MNLKLLAEKLAILNNVALESVNSPSEQNVIKQYTLRGLDVLGADFGYAWFRSPRSKKFQLIYKSPGMPYEPEYPRSKGMTALALQRKNPILIPDVVDKRGVKRDAKEYMKSAVVIPITYKKDTYGIFVLCYKQTHKFSNEDKDLSMALGNSAAQAITINRLYNNLREFKDTLDSTLDSIFIFDSQTNKLSYVNEGAQLLTGQKRAQLVGRHLTDVINGLTPADLDSRMAEIINNDKLDHLLFESSLKHPHLGVLPVEISLQHIKQKGQPGKFLAIVRDISERKEAEELIRQMAFYDPLTKLPNRTLFTQRLQEEYKRAKEDKGMFSVFFIDLDRFKVINDIYGHHVGDELLTAVASRLLKVLPKKTTLCRMGGDEFMVLLPRIKHVDESIGLARLIQEQFIDYFEMSEQEVYVNCSVGLANYPNDGSDVRTVLKHADLALHRAKEQGGNSYQLYNDAVPVFYSMQPQLEKQLREAIKKDELVIHYQPVMNLKTKKIAYCEALVRWNHPEMGLLYPDAFIGPAEESGLINDMGNWILNEVASQIVRWRREGKRVVPVSINVSPRQLLRPTFVKQIETAFEIHKIRSSDIKLELTETFLMKNIDLSVGILEQLKMLGLQILIDDFGTGYASLNYLKRLPIDGVKIDRTFIHGSIQNLQDAALTSAIIAIAHQLDLEVVAEGVETDQQVGLLKDHKCNYAQGNYFYKPMEGKSFSKLLDKQRK